jgi:hypothetical protein
VPLVDQPRVSIRLTDPQGQQDDGDCSGATCRGGRDQCDRAEPTSGQDGGFLGVFAFVAELWGNLF